MEIIAEVLRRAALVLLVARVFLQVVVGEMYATAYSPRLPRQLGPKGYELRSIRRIGPRIVAVQFRLLIA